MAPYEVVYGHRREPAALGWTRLEAIVEGVTDDEAFRTSR